MKIVFLFCISVQELDYDPALIERERESKSNHQLDENPVSFRMYVCIIKLIVEPLAEGQSIDRQCIYIVESENWTRIINRSVVLLISYLLFLSSFSPSRSFFFLISADLFQENSDSSPRHAKYFEDPMKREEGREKKCQWKSSNVRLRSSHIRIESLLFVRSRGKDSIIFNDWHSSVASRFFFFLLSFPRYFLCLTRMSSVSKMLSLLFFSKPDEKHNEKSRAKNHCCCSFLRPACV